MSIEETIFPVDGNTEWCYYFQGATEADYSDNAEGTVAYDLHELNGSFPTTQETGYGDAVKSDGVDKGRAGDIVGNNRYLQTDSNWTPPADLTQEFIVFINGFDGYSGVIAGLLNTTANGSTTNYIIRTDESDAGTNEIIVYACKSGGSYRLDSGTLTDLRWYYVAVTHDSAGPGGIYATLYFGNLTTPDANLTKIVTPAAGTQGAVNNVPATITILGENHVVGYTSGSTISAARAQGEVLSEAALNTRFDLIKAWSPAASAGGRRYGMLDGVGRGIGRGMHKDSSCGLIEPTLRETYIINGG